MADNDIEDGLINIALLYIVENLRTEEEDNIEEPGQLTSRKMGSPKAGPFLMKRQVKGDRHSDIVIKGIKFLAEQRCVVA
jgi:hypothetical protein